MKAAQVIVPEAVLTDLSATGKDQAVTQLVAALVGVRGIDGELATKDLAARERAGPTVFAAGGRMIAIPHASSGAARQLMMAIGVSAEGVDWGAAGGRANLIVVLLGPPEAHALYLRVLSRIAALCQIPGFIDQLLSCPSPKELIGAVAVAEERLGEIPEAEGLPRFCVVGAGHGGMAMAGHLTLTGVQVNLLGGAADRIDPVRARGGIEVTGQVEGFAQLKLATCDPGEALASAQVIMVVVPANAHGEIAQRLAPHLHDGQVLILNPGRTGGALEVSQVVRKLNPAVHIYLGEAQTLLYACRVTDLTQVRIFSIKNSVPVATLPAYHVADVLPLLRKALPAFVPGDNVLKTGLDNIGAVFHPAITVLNAGRIEDTHGEFDYYIQGVTPSVAAVLETVDQERVSVAEALGVHVSTARQWLYLAYDAVGRTLLDAIRANPGYVGIRAPGAVLHRYIDEDVPASLVPIASIGEMLGVPTPAIRSIIHLASVMYGVDFWKTGRTVDRLGIRGMTVKEIQFLVAGAIESTIPAAQPAPPVGADIAGPSRPPTRQ
ncbi:MAG: hypothetical protein BIFFINMI_00220 [Phycisphaerae bacterium]|nr:hypothetical protein [Phycisphaerae bacterium]